MFIVYCLPALGYWQGADDGVRRVVCADVSGSSSNAPVRLKLDTGLPPTGVSACGVTLCCGVTHVCTRRICSRSVRWGLLFWLSLFLCAFLGRTFLHESATGQVELLFSVKRGETLVTRFQEPTADICVGRLLLILISCCFLPLGMTTHTPTVT